MSMDRILEGYLGLFANPGDKDLDLFEEAFRYLIETYVHTHTPSVLDEQATRAQTTERAVSVLNSVKPTTPYAYNDHAVLYLHEHSTPKGTMLAFIDGLVQGLAAHYETQGHQRPLLTAIHDIGNAWYDVRRNYTEVKQP